MYYLAEFQTVGQLDGFAKRLGLNYTLRLTRKGGPLGVYREFDIDREIDDPWDGGFWKMSDLPDGAKPFLGLSNGSIVTCYFVNDGDKIRIFRPNPNAEEVYHPMSTAEHIAYQARFGAY